jgi:pyrrolysine biosynthesis protein PylC
VCGEHIMAEHGPLHLETDFFGADEALTSLSPGKNEWVATLMVTGSNLEEAWKRRDGVIGAIRDRFRPAI